MTKVVIEERRISKGYYTYSLEVKEPDNLKGIIVYYGDMAYFGESGTKTIDEAMKELEETVKKELGVDKVDIEVVDDYEEYRVDRYLDKLKQDERLRDLAEELERITDEARKLRRDIVIVVEGRFSESYYDYRLHSIWVKTKYTVPLDDNSGVIVKHIIAGAFQDYSIGEVEEILKRLGFEKVYQ